MNKTKTIFLSGLICTSLAYGKESPNIVFIMADDWGWTDWQMNGDTNGSSFYETPNLDKLAQQGVYFSQAYAQPLCSPTRAALMSGKYPGARIHMHQAITGNSVNEPVLPETSGENQKTCWPETRDHLPLSEITIAEELKLAGYKTFHFGKWHLGNRNYYPTKQGFDSQFAVGGAGPGSGGYFAPYAGLDDISQGPDGEYIAERLTDEVCKKLDQIKDDKFFIYMSHYNVHSPYQGKADLVSKYDAKMEEGNKHRHPIMAAMIESLDASIGKVMDKLDELGLSENTILVVMGDNGGIHWENDKNPSPYVDIPITSNSPLRAGKACFYEGGVRVPLIIKYPPLTEAGRVENTPVHVIDFYPTLLSLAGTSVSPQKDVYDGVDITALIDGTGTLAERPLFCHFPRPKQLGADVGGSFVRMGDYKLCRLYGLNSDASDGYELYNIKMDPGEAKDSANYLPAIRDSLMEMLDKWLIETKALVPKPNPNWTNASDQKKKDVPGDLTATIIEENTLTLSWIDNSDGEDGFVVMKSPDGTSTWEVLDTVPQNETEFTDNTLDGAAYRFYKIYANYTDSSSDFSNVVAGRIFRNEDDLPAPWKSVHFGTIAAETHATYNGGTFTVDAGDFDAWGTEDRIHFIYKPFSGSDFEMSLEVIQLDNTQAYAQGGIMFRETLDAGSKQVSMFLMGDKRKLLRDRVNTGGETNQKPLDNTVIQPPYWLKLVRSGNSFTGYYSSNGINWSPQRSVNADMANDFYFGIASASHNYEMSSIMKYANLSYTGQTGSNNIFAETQYPFYPNPAQKNIHIPTSIPVNMLRIFDVSGQQVLFSANKQTISVEHLKKGLYIVQINDKMVGKLIKN